MKKRNRNPLKSGIGLILAATVFGSLSAETNQRLTQRSHDRNHPQPRAVVPGNASVGDKAGTAPSDAVVLFDGTDLSSWVAMDGSATKWEVKDGNMVCVPASGYIRTRQSFGDCQLHVEWASPNGTDSQGQGKGNSGVFFGLDRYEIQVLNSHENPSYADGGAGSIYGQYPPMVNATTPTGEWQSYDIIYTAPRFHACGKLKSPAVLTVFHNGVLIQNHSELTGPTAWIDRPPYHAHPEKMPIAFQDHGNPVRFRNVWVRELDSNSTPEYYLSNTVLDQYVGEFESEWGAIASVTRSKHGTLKMELAGASLTLFAQSENLFFAKTTDVLVKFELDSQQPKAMIAVGDNFSPFKKIR